MMNRTHLLLFGLGLSLNLLACAQPTAREACQNQWALCLSGTEAASFLTESEFLSSCENAANGENETGTGASDEEIACVADAVTCEEIDPCVE